MKWTQLIAASLLWTLFMPTVGAKEMQDDLKIREVFLRYGKSKNATVVELSHEMLETYNLAHYRSIIIRNNPEATKFIRRCLESDRRDAKKIREVTEGGEIISAYYQLPTGGDINRFILFKEGRNKDITLVYIEGEIDGDDLTTILFTR